MTILRLNQLTAEERKSMIEVLRSVYNEVAFDVWGDRTPKTAEFIDVLVDQFDHVCDDKELRARFHALGANAHRTLCREVGP